MPRPNASAWVDETGVGDGTVISAARMENIENAIAALSPVPLAISSLETFTVAANTQVLYGVEIANDGEVVINGELVYVVGFD